MPKRILTQLVKKLAGKPVTNIEASDFTSELFPHIVKPQTLRLITTLEFARFGNNIFKAAMGEKGITSLEDFPPSCQAVLTQPFWFELIDGQAVKEADLNNASEYKKGIAISSSSPGSAPRIVAYNKNGILRSRFIDREEPKGERIIQDLLRLMVGAAFVMYEMPSVFIERSETFLKVPPFLKTEQLTKEKPLFSTVYLNKKFSDSMEESIKDGDRRSQKTLDISGRRYHYVLPHYYHYADGAKKTWKKLHWRGDIDLGVVRKIYKGAMTTKSKDQAHVT